MKPKEQAASLCERRSEDRQRGSPDLTVCCFCCLWIILLWELETTLSLSLSRPVLLDVHTQTLCFVIIISTRCPHFACDWRRPVGVAQQHLWPAGCLPDKQEWRAGRHPSFEWNAPLFMFRSLWGSRTNFKLWLWDRSQGGWSCAPCCCCSSSSPSSTSNVSSFASSFFYCFFYSLLLLSSSSSSRPNLVELSDVNTRCFWFSGTLTCSGVTNMLRNNHEHYI